MTTATESQIEREAARIAAAFGVEVWSEYTTPYRYAAGYFRGQFPNGMFPDNRYLAWEFQEGKLCSVEICEGVPGYQIPDFVRVEIDWLVPDDYWELTNRSEYGELMARGLYRLGFSDESVLSQLPSLTAHEKLELRLSMPREFWPDKWKEEEM